MKCLCHECNGHPCDEAGCQPHQQDEDEGEMMDAAIALMMGAIGAAALLWFLASIWRLLK